MVLIKQKHWNKILFSMKNMLFTFAVLLSGIVFSQDSTVVKVKTPKIISKFMYGKTIEVEDLEFKFVAVESDSRCPKHVQCIWAGEAVVLINVFKNGKQLESKRIAIPATGNLEASLGDLFSSEKLKVSSIDIAPYPELRNKINPKDYYITLDVRK